MPVDREKINIPSSRAICVERIVMLSDSVVYGVWLYLETRALMNKTLVAVTVQVGKHHVASFPDKCMYNG